MRKQLTLLLICMLLPAWSHAQSLIMGDYIPSDPQVWNFIKYGGQTPDLYTGTVRAEIPIYTYEDLDFEGRDAVFRGTRSLERQLAFDPNNCP